LQSTFFGQPKALTLWLAAHGYQAPQKSLLLDIVLNNS
jgi:hypothetical protein